MPYTPYSELVATPATSIRCPFKACHAKIIPLASLEKVSVEDSPHMTKVSEEEPDSTAFLQVNDVWDFDNIGVSRPAEDLQQPHITSAGGEKKEIAIQRLLICSECDKGPLGFAGIPAGSDSHHNNLVYFLSCKSLLYE